MNETSLTKDADAGSVVVPKQVHAKAAFASFNGLEMGSAFMSAGSSDKSYCLNAAEPVKDSAPVASDEPMDYFRFMAEAALDQGFLTPAGFTNLMEVRSREDLR